MDKTNAEKNYKSKTQAGQATTYQLSIWRHHLKYIINLIGPTISPLAAWLRPGKIGLMGRPCTYESLGGKQGKSGGLVVQTPGA